MVTAMVATLPDLETAVQARPAGFRVAPLDAELVKAQTVSDAVVRRGIFYPAFYPATLLKWALLGRFEIRSKAVRTPHSRGKERVGTRRMRIGKIVVTPWH